MGILESLQKRRSYYAINKNLPVAESVVEETVKKAVSLVPDAFNSKTQRVVVAFGNEHDKLWDNIFEAFNGKVAKEKLDTFKNGAGTVLYFYDKSITEDLQNNFPTYADKFPVWANHANGMLQLTVWSALRDLEIGASLQHYNPVIDEVVRKQFDLPENYVLLAQMPFGGISQEPEAKESEDINLRVKIAR